MATYYWVGGTGTWNAVSTTNWATSSNGAGGAGVPTAADNVIIDTASGTGTISCTPSSATCLNLTVTATQASTLSGTLSLFYGSLTLPSSGSFTFSVALTFIGSNTGRTITTNNKSTSLAWTFNNTGDVTITGNVTSSINHYTGTLNLGSGIYTGGFVPGNGTGPATLNMDSAYLSLTGASPWTCNPTNYTLNAGTSTIDMIQNAGTFAGGGKTYYIVKLSNVQSGTLTITGVNAFNTLNIYGPTDAGIGKTVQFAANQGINTLLTTSSLSTARVKYISSVAGTQRIILAGELSTPNSDFKDINSGTPLSAPFGAGDLGNNSNITFNTQTAYWIGGTGNWLDVTKWSLTSGGSAVNGVPQSTNSVIFDANSNITTTAFTVTVNSPSYCNDFSTGGAGGALDAVMTFAGSQPLSIYGSLTLPATNFTTIHSGSITFAATTTGKTITTNGVSLNNLLTFDGVGGGWTLSGALSNSGNIIVTRGTFNTGNQSVLCQAFESSNSNVRTINLGSSTITVNFLGIDFSVTTNLTFNAGTSTFLHSAASGTFSPGGLTFYNYTLPANPLGFTRTISGSGTFNNVTIEKPASIGSHIVDFSAGGVFTINGTLSSPAASVVPTRRSFFRCVSGQFTFNAAAVNLGDIDFYGIVGIGAAAPFTGTKLGNIRNNTGITFDAAKTVYWNLVSGGSWTATAWATSLGGTPADVNYPLPQDTVVIGNIGLNSGATISIPANIVWSADLSTRVMPMIFNVVNSTSLVGNFKVSESVRIIADSSIAVYNNPTISVLGKTLYTLTLSDLLGFNLGSNLVLTTGLSFLNGSLNLNGYNLTCTVFNSNSSNVREINFGSTGQINLTGNATTVWNSNLATNLTILGTPTINATYTGSVGTRLFSNGAAGGGTEANSLILNITGGSDILNIGNPFYARKLNFTGFSGTLGTATVNYFVYGDITFSPTMTLAPFASGWSIFPSNGTANVTFNGKTIDGNISIGVNSPPTPNCVVKFLDSLTQVTGKTLTFNSGYLHLPAGQKTTVGTFVSAGTGKKYLMSTVPGVQATISQASGIVNG